MSKRYDAKMVEAYCDAMTDAYTTYISRIDDAQFACNEYCCSESIIGMQADAMKEMVGKGEVDIMDNIIDVISATIKAQEWIRESFYDSVDASPDAILDEDTLAQINRDLRAIYRTYDEIGLHVESIHRRLEEFSKYLDKGYFTKPNFEVGRKAAEALCGGDGKGGFIQETIDKLIDFDSDATAKLRGAGLGGSIEDLSSRLNTASEAMKGIVSLKTARGNYCLRDVALNPYDKGQLPRATLCSWDIDPLKIEERSPDENDFFPTKERKFSEAEKELLRSLSIAVKNYKRRFQDLKTVSDSNLKAMDYVISRDRIITNAAEKYDVKKEMIQAILFQEQRFYGLEDIPKDELVKFTHVLQTVFQSVPFLPNDSSTGAGQVFAKTAIEAYNWYAGEEIYDVADKNDIKDMWNRLQNEKYNIEMVALVLKHKNRMYSSEGISKEQEIRDTFTAYNGSGSDAERYGKWVYHYYEAFKEYETGK